MNCMRALNSDMCVELRIGSKMSLTFSGIGKKRAAAAGGRLANWPNVMSLTRAIRIFNDTSIRQSKEPRSDKT